ncbi:MAG: lipoprotein [Ramlibacter sp.]|nr:lipoprotein [Ramlibacter sp.]
MQHVYQILVSPLSRRLVLAAGVVATLAACGQKGPLFLPSGEASAARATLPQTVMPAPPTSAPATTGTASPIRTP